MLSSMTSHGWTHYHTQTRTHVPDFYFLEFSTDLAYNIQFNKFEIFILDTFISNRFSFKYYVHKSSNYLKTIIITNLEHFD